MAQFREGKNQNSNISWLKKNCLLCGKEFLMQPFWYERRKYCSKNCQYSSRKGVATWNKGLKTPEHIKKKISEGGLGLRKPQHMIDKISGANNHNWRGGITPINEHIRKSLEYKLWRNFVFERDNYTCQFCGQVSGDINAHHILPFSVFEKERFNTDNGVTLCGGCHDSIPARLPPIRKMAFSRN